MLSGQVHESWERCHIDQSSQSMNCSLGLLYSIKYNIIITLQTDKLVCVIMLYFTELPVPVAAVSVFYTPDDGRMMPETCRESLQ